MSSPSPSSSPGAPRSGSFWEAQSAIECRFPELWMRVYATPQGMKLTATLYHPGERFTRRVETIAEAVWQPSEVTELSVADWGSRALRKWLEDQMLPGMSEL